MTGDAHLRTLAANFCATMVAGGTDRVNAAIEILHRLLKAARDAGGDVDAAHEIAIEWEAKPYGRAGLPIGPPDLHLHGIVRIDHDYDSYVVVGSAIIDQELAPFAGQWVRLALWRDEP